MNKQKNSSENFEIKKYYISPDELEDIVNIFNDDEKEPEIQGSFFNAYFFIENVENF